MVWNTQLCLARWGQPPRPGFAPSWSPVKINPVLAKPRTVEQQLTAAAVKVELCGMQYTIGRSLSEVF